MQFSHHKASPDARNISAQHLKTYCVMLRHVLKRAGQTPAKFSTQHVDVYDPQTPTTQQVDLARML